MTVTLAQMRVGFATAASTISGLNGYDKIPDQMQHPALIPFPKDMQFHDALGEHGHATFTLFLLVSPEQQGWADGQTLTDPYLDPTGAQSVKAAIEAGHTLGGIVDAVVVHGWDNYGVQEPDAGLKFWGVQFEAEVWW